MIKNAFRIIDTLLFSVLLLLFILPYIYGSHHTWIVITIYLCILTAVLLIRMRYKIGKQRTLSQKKTERQQIERILLLNDGELSERFGKRRFILIRKERPDRFDVMEAIRKKADAIGLFTDDAALKELIAFYSPETTVYLSGDLINAYFTNKDKDDTGKTLLSTIAGTKLNRYLILGILFLAASVFLRSKIYYRMIATVCLIIASVSGILGRWKSNKNFLIFLDKLDD